MKFTYLMSICVYLAASVSAQSADLPKSQIAVADRAAEGTPHDWTGLYAGLNAALKAGNFKDEVYGGYYGNRVDGSSIGGQIGYNFAVENFVLGARIEGDLDQVSGANSNWDVSYYKNTTVSVLGRVGLMKGAYMPYLTGGYSAATVSDSYDDKLTLSGWTVGVGADYVLSKNLVGEIEYRYTDYGDTPDGEGWYELHVTDATLRAGIIYFFH